MLFIRHEGGYTAEKEEASQDFPRRFFDSI